ncbi:MAG: hypothetical protein QXT45_00175 [Candidatus Bilamarchaeaceae archaeon]
MGGRRVEENTAVADQEQPKQAESSPSAGQPEKKDPAIAALIALICGLLIGAAGAGYVYIGKVKKGIIYIVAVWIIYAAAVVLYILGVYTVIGALCCIPLLLIPIALELAIVWDVYLDASGKKTILPNFGE